MDASNIFEVAREKGSEEFLKSTEGKVSIWYYLLALMVILLVAWGSIYALSDLEPEYKQANIAEVDGVLYYPDGMPVRNYEQLGIYLSTPESSNR